MYSVPIGSARIPVPTAELCYVEPLLAWVCNWPYGDTRIALQIGGDEDSPDGRLLSLAELLLPHLQALEVAADAYLRSFFRHADAYRDPWTLQALRLGMPAPSRSLATGFDVRLANRDDDHGEWRVGFRRHSIPVHEVTAESFSRKQW
jgi:hypothetical protein